MEKLEEKADGKTEFSMLSMMSRVTMDIIGKVPAVPLLFPLQLAGRNGSNAYQQQDGIRSWRQGERPLPSSARRPAGLIVPLPFGLSLGEGAVREGSAWSRCGLQDGDPLQKSFQPHTSHPSMPKGTHQDSLMGGGCVTAITCQHEVCLTLPFPFLCQPVWDGWRAVVND